MKLIDLLTENKIKILEKWIDHVLGCYPADTARIFKKQKDRFANPVGYQVSRTLTKLYEALLGDGDLSEAGNIVEDFVKILAVQEAKPSDAVSFIYMLKYVVREEGGKSGLDNIALSEWLDYEAKIDAIAYAVFDLYMASRERLYQIRIKEIKSGNHILTDGACPSGVMRRNKANQTELKPLNIHSST